MGTSPVTSPTSGQTPTAPATNPTVSSLANQNTFLQLLVAQLQNQDPLNPQDGTQFVSQLAQLSELQQVVSLNQNVSTIATDLNSASTASSASGSKPTTKQTAGS